MISFKSKKFKKTGFLIVLFGLPLAQYLVFWLYVNVQTIALSFQRFNVFEGKMEFVWFENYIRYGESLLKNPTMLNAFKNTFHSLWINLIILPIAVVVSYAFSKKVPGERFFRVAFYLPSMVSIVVLTLCFKYMFNNNPSVFVGPMASILKGLGIDFAGWDASEAPNTVWTLVYLYCIWAGLGTNVIMMSGALNRIPRSIIEQAKLDGVGFWRELICIDVPLIMPTVSTFILTGVMSVFGFYLAPMLLSGSQGVEGAVYTIPWYIFEMAQSGAESDLITVTTIGMIFSLIMLPIIILTKVITDKLTPDVSF